MGIVAAKHSEWIYAELSCFLGTVLSNYADISCFMCIV